MKFKGNEKIFDQDENDYKDEKNFGHEYDDEFVGGVQKIKTAIGKMRKSEDSMYRNQDPKRFKKK